MNINDIAKEIHENAVAHGWWEEDRGFPEIVALCHSELSEALEEYRNNRPMAYTIVEMIDCVIRILDWCAKEGVDVEAALLAKHEYNKTRPYRHGGKKC